MRRTIAAVVMLAIGVTASGCIIESKRSAPVSLQNNSEQVVVLRQIWGNPASPHPMVTAGPHKTATRSDALGNDQYSCLENWDIADEGGKTLKAIDEVCPNQVIVYP